MPAPDAVQDASGNFYKPNPTDPNNPIMINEMIVNSAGEKWAQVAKFHLEQAADGSLIPFTPDLTASQDAAGNIYTLTGGSALPKVAVVQGDNFAQDDAAAAVATTPAPAAATPAAVAPASAPRGASRSVETQASAELLEWGQFDMGRAITLCHSRDMNVVRRTLRRLHIRFWHAGTKRMELLLKTAGAPPEALKALKEIVDTCRICRMWTKPRPKSMTTTRLATEFNQIV